MRPNTTMSLFCGNTMLQRKKNLMPIYLTNSFVHNFRRPCPTLNNVVRLVERLRQMISQKLVIERGALWRGYLERVHQMTLNFDLQYKILIDKHENKLKA